MLQGEIKTATGVENGSDDCGQVYPLAKHADHIDELSGPRVDGESYNRIFCFLLRIHVSYNKAATPRRKEMLTAHSDYA